MVEIDGGRESKLSGGYEVSGFSEKLGGNLRADQDSGFGTLETLVV